MGVIMEPISHKLDSYGDIILVLDEQDAAYEDNDDFHALFELPSLINEKKIEENLPETSVNETRKGKKKRWAEPKPVPADEPEPIFAAEPQPEPEAEIVHYWPGEAQERAREADEDELEEKELHAADNSTLGGEPHPVRFQVSSKHLTLASPTFKIMLKREWTEGHTLDTQGTAELRALGTTQEALRVFLSAIHGRTHEVPRTVGVRLLCEVAVLVDYYKSYDALQFYVDTWIKSLTYRSEEMTQDSVRWLCISWVFKRGDIFESVTRLLQRQAKAPLHVSKLPISGAVIDKINQSREVSIKGIISALHDVVEDLESGKTSCRFECDSMRLGALRKQLKSRHLLNPRPSSPYLGYSFSRLCESLRKIGIPPLYEYENYSEYQYDCQYGGYQRRSSPHICRIGPTISSIINNWENSIEDMKIDKYLGKLT